MSNTVGLGLASLLTDKILTCAKYLRYLPDKSIVRNGYSDSHCYFTKYGDDWIPCDKKGNYPTHDDWVRVTAEDIFMPVEVMRRGPV